MLYRVSIYCISDTGYVRQNNEDSWNFLKDEQFFVVADGMGGHQAGEIASRITVDKTCELFKDEFDIHKSLDEVKETLSHIIQEVNASVYLMGSENSGLKGMGTTLCCIYFHPDGLIYGHVGDSRIYRFREDHLEQLTKDHSLLCELIDLGQLNEEQADHFLYKNIITKAIGTEAYIEPSIRSSSLKQGDIILMCTDGLSDLVTLEGIQSIIKDNQEENIARALVEKAKKKGGYDNITVILVKVEEAYETHLS